MSLIENAVAGDGEALRAVREELGVTATETAFRCSIDIARLSKFENNVGRLSPEQKARVIAYLRGEALKRHAQLGKLVAAWPVAHRTAVGA